MRKCMPSSVALSNTGAAHLRALLSPSFAFATSTAMDSMGPRSRAGHSPRGRHEEGNSAPGLFSLKSLPMKCQYRSCLTEASFPTRLRSCTRWHRLVSGGTKSSPSARLSESWGLKTSRNRLASWSASLPAPSPIHGQNRLPRGSCPAASSWGSLARRPATSTMWETSKLSMLRSTPLRFACSRSGSVFIAMIVRVRTRPMLRGETAPKAVPSSRICRRMPRPTDVGAGFGDSRICGGFGPATIPRNWAAWGTWARAWSRPNSTPP
mmetsp:Transcript_69321/g.195483  ORF Transcript_69321/g.195483 Transcript_69321/m.195483 type:complete len:266 (-) Transcript_69321:594-1391(-)